MTRPDLDGIRRREAFALANRAFDLFTLSERQRALEESAGPRYPSIAARFFEAVHRVVHVRKAPSND